MRDIPKRREASLASTISSLAWGVVVRDSACRRIWARISSSRSCPSICGNSLSGAPAIALESSRRSSHFALGFVMLEMWFATIA